ncbi:MAG TPA: hypothetical protein PKZ97_08145 [Azospirillaceae bacterium]|nr:hypothetical protein [Azospirillaceae bacterium]HRQ81075.1 hypothetical protein [Azospirillaceae bacterium]
MKRRALPPSVLLALFAAVAALLTHAFAWGLLAPAMALAPIDGFCTVAQYDGPNDPDKEKPRNDPRHCALTLLAQGMTAPPTAPVITPPAVAAAAIERSIPIVTPYVGWFLSTRQARGPPGGA